MIFSATGILRNVLHSLAVLRQKATAKCAIVRARKPRRSTTPAMTREAAHGSRPQNVSQDHEPRRHGGDDGSEPRDGCRRADRGETGWSDGAAEGHDLCHAA